MATKYDFPQAGCYIDESAGSAETLNKRILKLAIAYGASFEIPDNDPSEEEKNLDYYQELNDAADSAVDFLNKLETRDNFYWIIEDNSLFLIEEKPEDDKEF